jgi:hypothetical protein
MSACAFSSFVADSRTAFGNHAAALGFTLGALVGVFTMVSWVVVVTRADRARPRHPYVAVAAVLAALVTGLAAFLALCMACVIAAKAS